MNRDTPGAVPSDDFPFLGPAISPRRRDLAAPLTETGELPGPFVGGMFQPNEATRASSAESAPDEIGDVVSDAAPAAEEEDVLPDLPAADWASDDFPWLMPAEPEAAAKSTEEPWRATGEVEELAPPRVAPFGDEGPPVQHFDWLGEQPAEAAEEPRASADESLADAAPVEDYEASGWEREPTVEARPADVSAYAPEAEDERPGFTIDSELAEDSWPTEGEGATAAEPTPAEDHEQVAAANPEAQEELEPSARSEPEFSAARFEWDEEAEEVEAVHGDRWDSGEGFRVANEPSGEAAVAETGSGEADGTVDAAPLPVGEWEEAAEQIDVAGAVEEHPSAGDAADPLEDVADRLERIARSLRSGKPAEGFEEGDPLQLLITGYALGYAQARKGRD